MWSKRLFLQNMEAVKLQTSPTHVTESRSKQEQASVNRSSLVAECEPEDNGEFSEEEEEEDEGLEEDECWNEELQEDTELQTPVDELDNLIQVEEVRHRRSHVNLSLITICLQKKTSMLRHHPSAAVWNKPELGNDSDVRILFDSYSQLLIWLVIDISKKTSVNTSY